MPSVRSCEALRFGRDGAQLFSGAAEGRTLAAVAQALADQPAGRPGIRLYGVEELKPLLDACGPIGRVAATILGAGCRPVRAIVFDKNEATNWSLYWHQDRTIAVTERRDVDGFGPWTMKDGHHHVGPPFALLAAMVTLRVHLDAVPSGNGPLMIAPGSHRLGRIAESQVPAIVERCGSCACMADAGDIWLYATPILHASESARLPTRRRVLQIDYAAQDLPGGLEWLGV